MADSGERQSANGRRIDDVDRADQISDGEDSVNISPSGAQTSVSASQSVTQRLAEIFVEDGDGDLLLQRSDREDGVLQWLRALDMQVMGACRADERLKPLLKLNVSTGVVEDGLLAHLSQRLATLSTEAQCTDVEIEEIPADKSGRSFLLKTSEGAVSYFWCSEKSKLLGDELLRKMKDLLVRKPSLAELTGISESRLNCFASHLRAYLTGSVITSAQASDILSATTADESKSSRFRPFGSQGSKTNLIYLGSLSPRSSSFKEGLQKSLSTIKSAAREKLRRRVENYVSCIDIDSLSLASSNSTNPSSSNSFQKDKLPEVNGTLPFSALNFLDVFGKSTELPVSAPEIKLPSSPPSPFSPQYCWCPPVASALQYTIETPNSLFPEPFSLPPLSSLLSSAMPSTLLTSKPLLNVAELPPLNFPSFLPEPIVRLPSSQQIPTFTPFICDPIVHIPVIDICSSGQGYLVSAGPSMSTSIPPLVDPLLPNSESTVEKSARETLRMLINSSNQPNPPLLNVLPNVLSSSNGEQNIFAAGSRGLYSGTRDVVAITNSMSTMGLVLLSEKSMGGGIGRDDLIDQKEKPSSSARYGSNDIPKGLPPMYQLLYSPVLL
ncbi:LOW QUALITY PROTEIN: hypothetical protein DH2020_022281 [Rehmannia glutinosa]|uniref:Flocculation protein n=1 Tax=Rehmannia glutinosa TaxID=99300 RepID=A0ABR0WCX5_REHGL